MEPKSVEPNHAIWRHDPFVGCLTDPFISGISELESGHPATSMRALSYIFRSLSKSQASADAEARSTTQLWNDEDIDRMSKVIALMDGAVQIYSIPGRMKKPEDFSDSIAKWCAQISAMGVGDILMVPGGWSGASTAGVLVHIVERTGADVFRFVTCNGGNAGLEYHPSKSCGPDAAEGDARVEATTEGAVKLRYKTCLTQSGISLARMTDVAWWSVQMSQWMKTGQASGEYQRAEVIYDVLLPWIGGHGARESNVDAKSSEEKKVDSSSNAAGVSGGQGGGIGLAAILAAVKDSDAKIKKAAANGGIILSLVDTLADPHADFRTPCRSGTDWWRSVWEAVRYVFRRWGMSRAKLKQLSMSVRLVMMDTVDRDLRSRSIASASNLRPLFCGFNRTPAQILAAEGTLERASDKTKIPIAEAIGSVEGVVAVYFASASCPKCPPVTEALKRWHESGRREVVLVGTDADPSEAAKLRSGMPWYALADSSHEARREMIGGLGVRGVPAVVLMNADLSAVVSWDGIASVSSSNSNDDSKTSSPREEQNASQMMSKTDNNVLRISLEQISKCIVKENVAGRLSDTELLRLERRLKQMWIDIEAPTVRRRGDVSEASKSMEIDEESDNSSTAPPPVRVPEKRIKIRGFEDTDLLSNAEAVERWAGRTDGRSAPKSVDLLAKASGIRSVAEASDEMQRCLESVRMLLARASEASASSRLALQYQIIQAIGHLFTSTLPIPKASSAVVAAQRASKKEADVEGECDMSATKNKDGDEVSASSTENMTTTPTATTTSSSTTSVKEASTSHGSSEDAELLDRPKELAAQLAQFLPQYSLETCIGVLEISEDSLSIAGNWLIAHAMTAETDLAAELARRRATRDASKGKEEKSTTMKMDVCDETTAAAAAAAADSNDGSSTKEGAASFRNRVIDASKSIGSDEVCIWSVSVSVELQLKLLRQIHHLALTFAAMWQAIDYPTRAFDAERSVVALSMLSIFDVVVRTPAEDKPLHVSALLASDGGYALSSTVCRSNRLIEDVSATMELHSPDLHRARGDALMYVTAMRRSCTKTLFCLRMPMKIEVKKYSSTCLFLKRLLARCGLPLIPRTQGFRAAPPEIEALCTWLFDDTTPLAQKHPAFGMMRDMVAVFKFLSTMVTREQELMARRSQRERAMWTEFSFSYEEGGRSRAWRTLGGSARLEWEVIGYRGAPEKDTADVDCLGFNGRHLFFGEGPVVQSPADPCRLLSLPHAASEDDILHADSLPSYEDTLSREEAELLFSFLTVPYARIPLVLNFFACKDRVTYLFNNDLQKLLMAVIFEAGSFVPKYERAPIRRVPERRTHAQALREERARHDDARLGPNQEHLGTTYGLLLNELRHAPAATLEPLLFLCGAMIELASDSSVYSPDAEFAMFILRIAMDMHSFVASALCRSDMASSMHKCLETHGRRLGRFLVEEARELLLRWTKEAEERNDIPTACVVHAYLSLLWKGASDHELREGGAVQCMGSAMFVRNWHGFGMGTQRSDANLLSSDPTDRLLRFLQAHGVDTEKRRVTKASLRRWTRGKGKPLYLRIGREVVRAPTFGSPWTNDGDGTSAPTLLPPADVPESALFGLLQRHRSRLIRCYEQASASGSDVIDKMLNTTMATALRNPTFVYRGWQVASGPRRGGFHAPSVEINVDLQSAEVMWRSDELRPVPDSMAQFNDFDALFGRSPMHCGLVKRQEHRHWVHLVGKDMDLAEWDAPPKSGENMGAGAPSVVKKPPPPAAMWNCAACTYLNAPDATSCGMCQTPRRRQSSSGGSNGSSKKKKDEPPPPVRFGGCLYDRPFDPYSDKPHTVASELWAVSALREVIRYVFPPPMKKMPFVLQLPHLEDSEDSSTKKASDASNSLRLLGLSGGNTERATWKEFVVTRNDDKVLISVFNLVSHGRRVYRSLVYASDARLSLHSLPIDEKAVSMASAPPSVALRSAGDIGAVEGPKASLVILRQFGGQSSRAPLPLVASSSSSIAGNRSEAYVPSRLLQGVIPGALLEQYRFWQADGDHHIRGDPLVSRSEWFGDDIIITLDVEKAVDDGVVVWRYIGSPVAMQISTSDSKLDDEADALAAPISLLRERSFDRRESSDKTNVPVDESKVLQLLPLGCTLAGARLALRKNGGDVARAATWMFQPANASAMASATEDDASGRSAHLVKSSSKSSEDASKSARGVRPKTSDVPSDWLVLVPIQRRDVRSQRSDIDALVHALTRMEHLSHILIWTRPMKANESEHGFSYGEIALVELPRLQLRFVPRRDPESGAMRMHMKDRADWWLSSVDNARDAWPCGRSFLSGLPHSLFLENAAGELHLLVPNHDVCRPRVQGQPFSDSLRFDRSSATWQEVMTQRYYSYPVHTSRAFLMRPTLASSLYLILMRILHRDYATAFALIGVCVVDVSFTAEERWVFDRLVRRTSEDGHPDAHACRLKLVLAVRMMQQQATTTMGNEVWAREIHLECDRYLALKRHVSAACRLTPNEEIAAMKMCKSATPRIRNRLAMRTACVFTSPAFDVAATKDLGDATTIASTGAVPRMGGRPWTKLLGLDPSFVRSRCRKKVNFVQYKPPVSPSTDTMEEKAVFEVLWKDDILLDSEGGSTRQLGLLFLYELLRGSVTVKFAGTDCTATFAQLFLRLFQLKSCRWGREQSSRDGGEEEDANPSRELMRLVNVSQHPERGWPSLPKDDQSRSMLERGVELERRSGPFDGQRSRRRRFRGFGSSAGMLPMMASSRSNTQDSTSLFIQFFDREFEQCVASAEHVASIGAARAIVRANLTVCKALKSQVSAAKSLAHEWSRFPAVVSDYACAKRRLGLLSEVLSVSDLRAMASRPLDSILCSEERGVDALLDVETKGSEVISTEARMPFDVSAHSAAAAPIARDMLRRLECQVKSFAKTRGATRRSYLRGLSCSDVRTMFVEDRRAAEASKRVALKTIDDLLIMLSRSSDRDFEAAATSISRALETCASTDATEDSDAIDVARYRLRSFARQYVCADLRVVTSALMSTRAFEDLLNLNPFLTRMRAKSALDLTASALLQITRVKHANRTASAARLLRAAIMSIQFDDIDASSAAGQEAYVRTLAVKLASTLSCKRHYMSIDDEAADFDPRFLVFEYVFGILLRRRQVEIVRSFYDDVVRGCSRVQQMIMGAGKTTVVGPLLTLLLADGNRLVTQVMPTALLQQTRTVMRNRFSTRVLPKSVFTLGFERSVSDGAEIVQQLHDKMLLAVRTRSVMCAAPEAIKSLFLKFVEQLHAIEQFDFRNALLPGQSARGCRIAADVSERLSKKSEMADAIAPILKMWRRRGLLVMDEVDVLLHPLRSELNFPIGPKYPIDLSGFRWDLPIHIIDGILAADCGMLSEPNVSNDLDLDDVSKSNSSASTASYGDPFAIPPILEPLHAALEKGRVQHAMQRSPHMILLDLQFYNKHLKSHVARWTIVWLRRHFVGRTAIDDDVLMDYLCKGSILAEDKIQREKLGIAVSTGLSDESQKLLNLAADWVQTLLPHVLGKINRVTFGMLTPADLASSPKDMPLSRRLMAVPFTGKDVPSRASEFAHPDVLIGLTILAARYSGIRKADLRRAVVQLKHDFSRQSGPRHARPAAALFRSWLDRAPSSSDEDALSGKVTRERRAVPVLPLPLFQPADSIQMDRLWNLLRMSPSVGHHWLRNHVFPKTMNFQRLKISACGHSLGGEILFGTRVGFSGTPSNLLPACLGKCQYEPDSDGRILHVLTSPTVVTATLKKNWTALSLLRDVATQTNPRAHALIDSGAIITGLDNFEVASRLMDHLPDDMLGVVFLDREDRKMVLRRGGGQITPLDRCGLRPEQRFTFYDHVHTTGMDIHQAPNAHAVQTIGKDMTFRDFAQGAYRMRGIGQGQTLELYLIPEVANRVADDLGSIANVRSAGHTGDNVFGSPILDIPAWLLLNAMRAEGLQFMQLSLQELRDVWRSRALSLLRTEALTVSADASSTSRMRRFVEPSSAIDASDRKISGTDDRQTLWLRKSVDKFRERVGFAVPSGIPQPVRLGDVVRKSIAEHESFLATPEERQRVSDVKARLESATAALGSNSGNSASGNARLKATVVHENEKQQEEEAQKQVQQQRIKISAFCRDDEEPHPWPVDALETGPDTSATGAASKEKPTEVRRAFDVVFYELSKFRTRDDASPVAFPPRLVVSDNWFRRSWIGVGARRLKAVTLVLDWQAPSASKKTNDAGRCVAVLCLSEGETIRRVLHDRASSRGCDGLYPTIALRMLGGSILDASPGFVESSSNVSPSAWWEQHAQCLRFLNTEMYYTKEQVEGLSTSLKRSSPADRCAFFEECLRLRQRERNLWTDTPIARLFTSKEEWSTLRARSVCNRLSTLLEDVARDGATNSGALSVSTLVRIFASPAQREAHEAKMAAGLATAEETGGAGGRSRPRSVHTWTPSDWTICRCIFENFGRASHAHEDRGVRNKRVKIGTCDDLNLGVTDLHRVSLALNLNFSVPDCVALVRFLGGQSVDDVTGELISARQFESAIPTVAKRAHLPASCATGEANVDRIDSWICSKCTCANPVRLDVCSVCGRDWTGQRRVPNGQWECLASEGGCTKYNPNSMFYCDVCAKARPGLATHRF